MKKKRLLIVESPTKARTIGRFLKGSKEADWEVVATVGHIRDLPKSKMGVDLTSFDIDYATDKTKAKVIRDLVGAAKKADEILLATDPDREGEAIAWHVNWILTESKISNKPKKANNQRKIFRISFHEITPGAVQEALDQKREIDMDLVNAQQGRRVLDRVVGYSLSPLLWKKVRRGLSAGRVQSVAVRLIVEREKEIERFVKEQYFKVWADLKKDKSKFRAELAKIDDKSAYKKEKIDLFDGSYSYSKSVLAKEGEVREFIKKTGRQFKIVKVVGRQTRRTPLPAYTTSKLQQAAARRMGWSGRQTMSVAQRLYEKGLITYHRTDSVYLSEKAIGEFRKYIEKTYGAKYVSDKVRVYKNTSKNAQEAHEAIRPTNAIVSELEGGDAKERRLYEMIWRRAVATQGAAAVMEKTSVDLAAGNGLFRANGVRMLFDGFLKISQEKHEDQILPKLAEGEVLTVAEVGFDQSETNPPPRYTDASLVSSLEKQGIGRPSTYAPIISTIQARQYVNREDGKYLPTALGAAANEFLVKNFPEVLSLPFTAEMEEDLDEVSRGELDWKKMMKKFWGGFEKEVKRTEKEAERVKVEVEKTGEKCPECKEGDLVVRVGRFGKFISCSRFPDCRYTAQFKEEAGFKCPECGGEGVVRRTKTGRRFYGCANYPKCKWAGWKKP